MSDSVAQDLLQSLVRRIESVEDEINALNSDKSEIYKEAKGAGFEVKVMRKLIADRRKDASERVEFETIYDLYAQALGMYSTPAERLVRAHVENIDEFPAHDADGVVLDDEPQPPVAAAQMQFVQDVLGGSTDERTATSPDRAEGIADGQPIQPETANTALSPAATPADANAGGENVAASFDTDTTGRVDTLLDDAGKSVEAPASAAPGKFDARSLRPHCKQPYACGGSGRQHCYKCRKAAGMEDAA